MLSRSINARVLQAGAGIFFITALVGGAGFWGAVNLSTQISDVDRGARIIRNHMQADMMHDALRSDVLAATLAAKGSTSINLSDVQNDIAEHAEVFRAAIAENEKIATDASTLSVISAVKPALTAYIGAAEDYVKLASTDPIKAEAALPDFNTKFSELEEAMGTAGDKIEAVGEASTKSAIADSGLVRSLLLLALAIALSFIIGLVWLARRTLVAPLVALTEAMAQLADGRTDINPPHAERGDEIGALAGTMARFRENALARTQLEQAQQTDVEAQMRRSEHINTITSQFSQQLADALEALGQASESLGSEAMSLQNIATNAQERANSASSAATIASENVESIAAATTELSASVEEIAQRMADSANKANDAVLGGHEANRIVSKLADSAKKIGEIVSMISAVTSQTNLLALNATIEAARAGEAGRGFAVVASEVKSLASQTEQATQEISGRISEVQAVSEEALRQVQVMIKMIEDMQAISSAVASAAAEQSAVTSDIASTVEGVSGGTSGAAAGVRDLQQATIQTGESSDRVLYQAKGMQSQTEALRNSAAAFFAALKAA
jgi:methyl-accepting chemotaxis protein